MKTSVIAMLVALPLVASGTSAAAQEEQAESSHEWLIKVEPRYPREARVNRIEGYVRLRFSVTESGEPRDITVVEAQPPGVFEEEAISALRRWRFAPAQSEGEYVPTVGEEVIRFQLSTMRPARSR